MTNRYYTQKEFLKAVKESKPHPIIVFDEAPIQMKQNKIMDDLAETMKILKETRYKVNKRERSGKV